MKMSREERITMVGVLRADRKKNKYVIKKAKKQAVSARDKLLKMFKGLSAEEQAKFLEKNKS